MNGDRTHSDTGLVPATGNASSSAESRSSQSPAQRIRLPRAGPRAPDNLFFRLLIPAGFLFCAAILMFVMAGLGHPESAVNIAIARYSPIAIGILAGVILVVGIAAMAIDRRRTLKLGEATPPKDEGVAKVSPRDS
jgi:hypothetical protein